jgi:sulfoxide reductase heme-binding subunit YedZ
MARRTWPWPWVALNLSGLTILAGTLAWGSADWNNLDTFDPGLVSGKWAVWFLLLSLAMTPLNILFGWSGATRLRKPAGLWAFGFALLHVTLYFTQVSLRAVLESPQPYMLLGALGLLILAALALTSNRWAMQRLKKNWKRLHRLVYLAGGAVMTHAILSIWFSKKIMVRDPHAINELRVALAVLVVLLVVRLPAVRRVLVAAGTRLRSRRTTGAPVPPPQPGPPRRPVIVKPVRMAAANDSYAKRPVEQEEYDEVGV